jgi:hypothetical protein
MTYRAYEFVSSANADIGVRHIFAKVLVRLAVEVGRNQSITADWSTSWSGSPLAGGRQIVPTVLDRTTGASSVMMAMSLA